MKKLNEKGFAFSTMLYGTLALLTLTLYVILDVSKTYAYKLIRKMNDEMKDKGFHTIAGRIDTKFFYEHFYGTKDYERSN